MNFILKNEKMPIFLWFCLMMQVMLQLDQMPLL